ncbi:hypothetical protein BC943DRAFT_315111 [Umbelopsis sp. AD052]|nr:hypothetical protein BC943DRAFT_315111 [Umbelopsis sp. AD052]
MDVLGFTLQDENGKHGDNNMVELTWWNVGFASLFIVINLIMSSILGLGLEKSLLISAIRCVVQLTIMGFVLEDVFQAKHPAIVILMTMILILLGCYEIIYNKSNKTFRGMFLTCLCSMTMSTLLVGIIGSRYAMAQDPFWTPEKFIPTTGMLLGNLMSGMAVAIGSCLSSLSDGQEKIETYLSYGATRWEAGLSVATESVRLAMLPTINQMSVIGLIAIPGMMTGQIMGGASVLQAARYQQIIMFMISASTALAVLTAVVTCVTTIIDAEHRIRPERILQGRPSLWKDIKLLPKRTWDGIHWCIMCCGRFQKTHKIWDDSDSETSTERTPLLN